MSVVEFPGQFLWFSSVNKDLLFCSTVHGYINYTQALIESIILIKTPENIIFISTDSLKLI